MGLLDKLFGRRLPSSPEEVRQVLFDAAALEDQTALAKLAGEHEATVLEHFDSWKKVPEAVRRDPAGLQAYAQGLIGLAQHFAQVRGRPELLAALTGRADNNPLTGWERALKDADARMEECDYAAAEALLRATLEKTKRLTGSAVDSYLPITLGRLATCLFQTGDAEGAVALFEHALGLCEAQRDEDGALAYLGSLYEAHRTRGAANDAATCLDRRADLHERLGQREAALRDRRQSAIVRAREPLCRVVVEIGGALMEITEVPRASAAMRFIFVRNRIALRTSTVTVDAAVARGEAGDAEAALAGFRRAAQADRFDPWPSYHAGMTLLHMRRYGEAVESFQTTEELAPGWYHCRADRWLAEQLALGMMDHALFERIRGLVDRATPAEQALKEARLGLAQKPLGVLHLMAGDALGRLGRDGESEAEYRRGLAIAEEPDVRTRLLAALGARVTERAEKERLLGEACALQGNLVASAMAAVMLRVGAAAVN